MRGIRRKTPMATMIMALPEWRKNKRRKRRRDKRWERLWRQFTKG
jgi:hypothetical protein